MSTCNVDCERYEWDGETPPDSAPNFDFTSEWLDPPGPPPEVGARAETTIKLTPEHHKVINDLSKNIEREKRRLLERQRLADADKKRRRRQRNQAKRARKKNRRR
jgi:hypothetical protein